MAKLIYFYGNNYLNKCSRLDGTDDFESLPFDLPFGGPEYIL